MAGGFVFTAVVLVLAVGAGPQRVSAIKCYQCSSIADKHCGDPVNITALSKTSQGECTLASAKKFVDSAFNKLQSWTSSLGSDLFPSSPNLEFACFKSKKTEGENEVVIRFCSPSSIDLCKEQKDLDYCEQCSSDLCNGVHRQSALPALLYALLPCLVVFLGFRADSN